MPPNPFLNNYDSKNELILDRLDSVQEVFNISAFLSKLFFPAECKQSGDGMKRRRLTGWLWCFVFPWRATAPSAAKCQFNYNWDWQKLWHPCQLKRSSVQFESFFFYHCAVISLRQPSATPRKGQRLDEPLSPRASETLNGTIFFCL